MKQTYNQTGDYCLKDGYICDHNLIDAPFVKMNSCSGYCRKCNQGSSWEWYEKETKILHRTTETMSLRLSKRRLNETNT